MKNLLLNQLSQDDFKRLEPYFKITPFKQHTVLFEAEREIEHVLTDGWSGVFSRDA